MEISMEIHLDNKIKEGSSNHIKDLDLKTTISIKRLTKIHKESRKHTRITEQKMGKNTILIMIQNKERIFLKSSLGSKKRCGSNINNNNNRKVRVIGVMILMILTINKQKDNNKRQMKNRNGKKTNSIKHHLKNGLKINQNK